ncbi:hypothetical protein BBK36DRAFT_1161814 [Trichoderma citrinoviride]|uniref:Uncharacterized protein n=1 Tax=Trichoderma citrinoviride TaxID=58853 RepID=A0A2T4B3U4_9HYPO|nr:hypothetical protein BBK36DRAFT_1161814 [Trichoderma citrinoviride]PTB63871.1 hypothetical protein BBK36DRAFT_1161814 [Trichoderma citrinoviride]
MSLHQRVSSHSRRASVSQAQSPFVPSDIDRHLLDSLNNAHTELNKTNSERDRYLILYNQADKKLTEATAIITDLKAQNQTFKDGAAAFQERYELLIKENDRLRHENGELARGFDDLKAKYTELSHRYNALNSAAPSFSSNAGSGQSGSLPERPKVSRSSSKKERKEDREERSRVRDREKSRDRTKEDKRDKEKEKEKDKEREKEKKEHKAEKERLSRRFEERRPAPPAPAPPPPPMAHRRNSFIEGWGPGGRSSSASGSSTRSYTNGPNGITGPNGLHGPHGGPHGLNGHNGHMGHVQVPVVTPGSKPVYASIPRTAANPMTPRIFSVAGSTAAVFDDDGSYEDGNYHPYPIPQPRTE